MGEHPTKRMEVINAETTLANFNNEFVDKYFLVDVCNCKKIELLEVKQGNMMMADYATKFEELYRFCPHYNGVDVEGSKCVKFKSGLHPEIKQFIEYMEICCFSVLVDKCRV